MKRKEILGIILIIFSLFVFFGHRLIDVGDFKVMLWLVGSPMLFMAGVGLSKSIFE